MNGSKEFFSLIGTLKDVNIKDITYTLVRKNFSQFCMYYEISLRQILIYLLTYLKPDISCQDIGEQTGFSAEEIIIVFNQIRSSPLLQKLYLSHPTHRNFYRKLRTMLSFPDRIGNILNDKPKGSLELELHPALFCNLKCVFCYSKGQGVYRYIHEKGRTALTLESWMQVVEEAKSLDVRKIALSGGYEPFRSESTLAIIERGYEIGVPIEIYTNGAVPLFSNQKNQEVLQKLRAIHFSFRGADPETHARVTRSTTKSYELLMENLRMLLYQKRMGKISSIITISFFVHQHNIDSISKIMTFAKDVESVNFSSDNYDKLGGFPVEDRVILKKELQKLEMHIQGLKKPLVTLNDALWLIYNENQELSATFKYKNHLCYNSFIRPTINPFGDVYRCCLVAQPNFNLPHAKLGTLNESTSLKTILASSINNPLYTQACIDCNPSERAGLAVMDKLKKDLQFGVAMENQPYRGLYD